MILLNKHYTSFNIGSSLSISLTSFLALYKLELSLFISIKRILSTIVFILSDDGLIPGEMSATINLSIKLLYQEIILGKASI